jgi:hypothetical protein
MGIQIFDSARAALKAGYLIESPLPDSEGLSSRSHAYSRRLGCRARSDRRQVIVFAVVPAGVIYTFLAL